jgi:hypothetical protein
MTDPREQEPPDRGNEDPQQDDDARLEYSIAADEWDEWWDEMMRDD